MGTVWLCLLPPSLLKYLVMCLLAVAGCSLQSQAAENSLSRLQQRQVESAVTPTSSTTRPVAPNSSFGGVLSDYWYVCLVLVVVMVVGCVFLCGCIVRKKRRRLGRLHISRTQLQRMESVSQADAPRGRVNSGLELVSAGSPGSASIGRSPISSPQPSFSSSHKSLRSSGHGSGHKKKRNHSPGHTSSGSEDTVRPNQTYSVSSLASSVSTLGPYSGRLHHAESFSSGRGSDKGAELSSGGPYQRSRSNSQVTAMTAAESPLHSAPSSLSIESRSSSRPSSQLASSRPSSRMTMASGVVKVDVKVHLGQEQPAHFQIAAALAESARQLAQSAANFEQEDTWSSSAHHSPRSTLSSPRGSIMAHPSNPSSLRGYHPSRRQLFSNHSAAKELSAMPIASLDRPANLVSLDRPANLVSLDRPVNTASLDRPGRTELARRSSVTSYKSLNSDYHRHAAPLEYGYRVPNIMEEPDGGFYSRMVRRGEDHTPNGFHHHYPVHWGKPLPATTGNLDFVQTGNKGHDERYGRSGQGGEDQGSRSGGDSNTSTLKALSMPFKNHGEATGNTSNAGARQTSDNTARTNEEGASEHQRQLSLLSEHGSVQDSSSLVEAPSPHSSSHPSLSRTGSALSLDPQLSSTASGYAATGSTSSLDTISKTDTTTQQQQSAQNVVFPEHSHPPATVLAAVGKAAPVVSSDSANNIHVARLAEAGVRDGCDPIHTAAMLVDRDGHKPFEHTAARSAVPGLKDGCEHFNHTHMAGMLAGPMLRDGYTTMSVKPGPNLGAAIPIPRNGGVSIPGGVMYHHMALSSEDSGGATSSLENFTIDV